MGHGEFIKKIRQEKHLTQKELAEGILSKNFLSKFERGESKITSEIFLNLLERLNVSLDEFEQLVISKHSQKEFLQKLETFKSPKDGYLLENLKAEEKQLFQSDRNRRHLHNQILVEAHLQYLQGKNIDVKQKRVIQSYLFEVEEWGDYEWELFGNIVFCLSTKETHLYLDSIFRKARLGKHDTMHKRMLCRILLNIFLEDIEANSSEASQVEAYLTELLEDEEFYYEKIRFYYLQGILHIYQGHVEKGKLECMKMIDIFKGLKERKKAFQYQEYLDYVLSEIE
jgi:transcriptional activator, rgg/gadR/mutR family, C-terminal domain